MKLEKELKVEIDFILNELLIGNVCSENKENTAVRNKSIRICKALNLIKHSDSGKQYVLAEKAVLVLNDGGIEKYLHNYKEEKNLDTEIKLLTFKKLKYEQLPAKFWWLIIIITTFVSIFINWATNQM